MTGDEAHSMQTLRFHQYGAPSDVLHLETTSLPLPGSSQIRVRVQACALNPADWALCQGLFPGNLPRGIGLDVAGTVDMVGDDVQDIAPGDAVLGAADFAGHASAGMSDFAVLHHWTRRPPGLGVAEAAALPLAVVTAGHALEILGVTSGQTLMVNGAGTTIGYAAVQMALLRGAHVVATAGATYAAVLRAQGVKVTAYGEGMAERVLALTATPPDLILDTAPPNGNLPTLVAIAGASNRVLTISDIAAAGELGIRTNFTAAVPSPYELLEPFAQRAADGTFSVPVARTFPLQEWRAALELSQSGQARGKVVLLLGDPSGGIAPLMQNIG